MRILLVNPPHILPYGSNGPYMLQPLGLKNIASALGEHEVGIFDAAAEGWDRKRIVDDKNYLGAGFDEIRRRIESFRPDMVGITEPSMGNAKSAFLVAMTAKAVDRGIVTVLGGPLPSLKPAETVMHPAVNFVVVGEGEHTMPELVKTIKERNLAGLSEVRGIAYKKDGIAVLTGQRQSVSRFKKDGVAVDDGPSVTDPVGETGSKVWGTIGYAFRQAATAFLGIPGV